MTSASGIDLLRSVARWVDYQSEDHWYPPAGEAPTVSEIFQIHSLCMAWDVETLEDLQDHDDPKARRAYNNWVARRGSQPMLPADGVFR